MSVFRMWYRGVMCLPLLLGCTPVVKPGAFDSALLQRRPLPADHLGPAPRSERVLRAGSAWFADVDPGARLTFVGLREADGRVRFCAVLACEPSTDRLALVPLADDSSPLEALADEVSANQLRRDLARLANATAAGREDGVIELSLEKAIRERRLASPIPAPGRIYAAAANFRSHLEHDLAIRLSPEELQAMRIARARVFLKFPPVEPDGSVRRAAARIDGPFDAFEMPASIVLPRKDGRPAHRSVTRLDYEVEVGAVLGRRLTWDTVGDASDGEIMSTVSGYVLISDTKARNPQVVDKIADEDRPAPEPSDPYTFGLAGLDRAAGFWDPTTCRWWSYAAGWADCTAVGPLFVQAPPDGLLPVVGMVSARSYADPAQRGIRVPAGRAAGKLYLRQCGRLSGDPTYSDALVWGVPDLIRSILAPERNALSFAGPPASIEPGDIIALGTPGGVVITSKTQPVLSFLHDLLFWWEPLDWHDAFFDRDAALYLHNGDEVFHWAEGLGYQLHTVTRTSAP